MPDSHTVAQQMDAAAMEATMSGQLPVTTVTFVRTGDPGLDLISMVLRYVNEYLGPEEAVRALQYAQDRIKSRYGGPIGPNRPASMEERMALLAKLNEARNLGSNPPAPLYAASKPPSDPDQLKRLFSDHEK